VATKRQVEAKLRELIRRLDAAEEGKQALARALPQTRVIQVEVPDLEQTYWVELSGGHMGTLHNGPSPGAHIRIRADSDELVHMVDGKRSLFSSYIGGSVKIEASFADLMRLRKLV
jgi:predicted lipid carrier protein YhbT